MLLAGNGYEGNCSFFKYLFSTWETRWYSRNQVSLELVEVDVQ